ncbi:UPF0711 protein C18orf21 homolog [Microcaecilia unicolor]|uniref:UPF0711 protein C18orf21 homolog n=1 Tax=Microcaecilia unicolor TaxID=1415580 RepID=A0A6P7YBP2_9AMPH|nr:UPF0711 protein C18orf21 homolog [Microcaecilia unicolor]
MSLRRQLERDFLARAALELRERCVPESRYLLYTRSAFQTVKATPERICSFCFQCLVPGSYMARLKPKMKATPQVQKLLKLEAKSHRLNLKQTKLLRRYKMSRSTLLITCNTCKRITKYPGESRSLLAAVSSGSSTPNLKHGTKILDMKTPTPVFKSDFGKNRSPAVTPRAYSSNSSTPSSSTKSAKKSKCHFSRLKMLLKQDKKQKSKKGDLKSFLSTL